MDHQLLSIGLWGHAALSSGTEEPAVFLAVQPKPLLVPAVVDVLAQPLFHEYVHPRELTLVLADALEAVDVLVSASSAEIAVPAHDPIPCS